MVGREKYGFGEQIIPHQDCNFILPKGIYGEEVSPFKALIHHIIVYKGSGVYQLYHRGAAVGFAIHFSQEFCTEEDKHRAHLLALGGYDKAGYFIQQRYAALHRFVELLLEEFHFCGYRSLYFFYNIRHKF